MAGHSQSFLDHVPAPLQERSHKIINIPSITSEYNTSTIYADRPRLPRIFVTTPIQIPSDLSISQGPIQSKIAPAVETLLARIKRCKHY